MNTDRLTSIALQLLNHKTLSDYQLARRYKVPVEAILLDVESLRKAGLPVSISADEKDNFLFSLAENSITKEELPAIFSALRGTDASPAYQKAPLSENTSSPTDDKTSPEIRIPPNDHEEAFSSLIEQAIFLQKPMDLQYIDNSRNQTRRRIEPIELSWQKSGGYLYAYCTLREDFRLFKLANIQDLTLVEGTFTHSPQDDYDLDFDPDWLEDEFDDDSPYFSFLLRCDPEILDEILFHFGEEVEILDDASDGYTLLSLQTQATPFLLGMLFTFSAQLQVIAPEEIRTLLVKKAKDLIDRYL